ncbi:hypothetical protein GBA52_023362 [Prunus armeniaca]|nr:hypothetical protein GBA52_023362 [Prunus armeniaca]
MYVLDNTASWAPVAAPSADMCPPGVLFVTGYRQPGKGEVEEEKLDSYDVHFYAPSRDEIEDEVRKEGSFELDRLELLELDQRGDKDNESYGTSCARTVRAIQESMIAKHFGEKLLDSLFETYGRLIDEESAKGDINPISFGIVLRKL